MSSWEKWARLMQKHVHGQDQDVAFEARLPSIGLHLSCDYVLILFTIRHQAFLKPYLIPKNTVHSIYIHICIWITRFIKPRETGYPSALLFWDHNRSQEAVNVLISKLPLYNLGFWKYKNAYQNSFASHPITVIFRKYDV